MSGKYRAFKLNKFSSLLFTTVHLSLAFVSQVGWLYAPDITLDEAKQITNPVLVGMCLVLMLNYVRTPQIIEYQHRKMVVFFQ